jgi:ureidoglycolate hydrolase
VSPDFIPLDLEPLTGSAFRPFGIVLHPDEGDPDFHGQASEGWTVRMRADEAELLVLSCRFQEWRVTKLERHFFVTQAAVPLGGAPSILVVAPPTPRSGVGSTPSLETLRAFLLDGTQGYLLFEGVWHSVDRYPLRSPSVAFVMITDTLTTDELRSEAADADSAPTRTESLEVATAFGKPVVVVDRHGVADRATGELGESAGPT